MTTAPAPMTDQQTTDDLILGGRVRLRQPAKGFRSGSDAVLLAAACHPPVGGRAVELGCGTGLPMLSLAARRSDLTLTGLEVQPAMARLAAFNIVANGWSDRVSVLVGDVGSLPLAAGRFDTVLANPPYFDAGRFRRSPDAARDLARVESATPLDRWVGGALSLLRPGGEVVLVLRRERLNDVRAALPGDCSLDVLPLGSRPGKPAKRFLARLRPATGGGVRECRPLDLHRPDGSDTELAAAIFRDAAAISWD